MGKINILIANSSNYFTETEVAIIGDSVEAAEGFINRHFSFDYDVDVVVTAPSMLMKTIPEDGVGGRTYNSRLIFIVLDKGQAEISKSSVFETVCHEMSHSLRWEKLPEYSDSLFKGMILEGLAVALEEKAVAEEGGEPQFFLKTILDTAEDEHLAIIDALKDSFESKDYDYERIFFTGGETFPRWAGYRLGYYYVKKYLEKTGRTVEEATLDSYGVFADVTISDELA